MLERSSPIRLFVTLLVLIFCIEAAVMVALDYLFPKGTSVWVEASIDAGLLTAIASIFVWRTFMRPLKFAYTGEAARAKAVMDGAAEGIITINECGIIESFNRAAEGMFGYKAKEAVGKNVKILMPEAHVSEHDGHIARCIGPGEDRGIGRPRELLALRKDATEFPIELTLTEIRLGDTRRFTGIIRDITERRRAEEARADLAAIVENSNDAIISRTLNGTITSWNAGAEKIFGYTAAEIVGRNISIIAPVERQHEAEHDAWLLRQNITVPPFETVRVAKDGRQVHVQISVSAIRDATGNVTRIAAIFSDITERTLSTRRRAMEHAVTKVLAESETLDEAMPKLIRTVCGAMEWAYGARWAWNKAERRLCRAEHWSDFEADFEPADRHYWLKLGTGGVGGLLRRAWLAKESTWCANLHEDESFRRKPSCVKFGLRSAYCFPILAGNEVVGVMEFFGREVRQPDDMLLQITGSISRQIGQFVQRKQAEEARAQLAAIVENSNDAIFSRTLDGIITSWNAGAERMLGYTATEAIGKPATFNLPPGRRPNMARNNEKVLRGEVTAPHESNRVTKDGRVIDVLTSHSPIRDHAGNIVGASVILQDISALKQAEAALRENEERFRATFEQAGVGMALRSIDPRNSRFLRVNQKLCDILGYTQEELLQLTSLDITLPEEREAAIVNYNEKLASGEFTSYSREKRYVRKDGQVIWANISLSAVNGPDGHPTHVISVIEDISERKRAETERARLATIVESANDAIIGRAFDGTILSWNAAAERLFGYTAAEAIGCKLEQMIPPQLLEERAKNRERVSQGELVPPYETVRLTKDGRRIEVSLSVSPIRDSSGNTTGMAALVRDITERKQAEARSDYLANYDVVTGLPNRRLFHDRLTLATARDRRIGAMTALLLLDLDRFKQINETFGHSAGDKLLRAVTARLCDRLREVDTVARFSGDEFAVILESVTEKAQALGVAEKIVEVMAEPFTLEGEEIFVTASVGATVYPVDADSVEQLVECAELAMYQAKQEGRNTAQLYTARQSPHQGTGLSMESRLRRAIERDEFLLHFQPKVDIKSGAITGAEALVRWRNPELGLVSPADFIPLAEETGLILPIGEWVLHSACMQASAWHRQGHPVSMAVNLSARQFRQKNLCEVVELTLADSGLGAGHLELEITEGMTMHRPDQTIAALRQLRDIGVMISVDDFGIGYSSLSYLKRFPVHKLKIDQSFVRELHENADDAAIVRAVIALAKSLNLKTVAEGVETEQQLIYLAGLQCDEYQGYYFSKPLPAAEFLSLLQAKRGPALGAGPSTVALERRAPDRIKTA